MTPSPSAQAALAERKGILECRLSGGIYRGSWGWNDTSKAPTACYIYLVINFEGFLKAVRVRRESVGERYERPKSHVEAACQQHEDLDESMDKLVKKLAQCRVSGSPEATAYFRQRLDKAYGCQINLGSKALWKEVEYSEEEDAAL